MCRCGFACRTAVRRVVGGPAGIEVDTNPAHANAVTVYQGPLHTRHVDYNTLGQKADTADAYGGQTTHTYDANGNVIETVNPDGTETRGVYDALNRVIWSTNSFDPANLSTAVTTRTVYNQLGQVVETQQYAGQLVTVGSKTLGSSTTPSTSVATTDGTADGPPTTGTLLSTTRTFYDAQGNAIETIGANGLRTGTVYTPDGKALYSGPLATSAPDGGHAVTIDGGVTTQAFTTADFAYDGETDPVQYDDALGLFYTRSVDEDGNATKSYSDSQGRSVRTVYADGSFTETLYSVGTTAVSLDQEGDAVPAADGWTGITGGGYEVVTVAQRKAGDSPVYTYDLYDAAGRLTDVWLPKVVDGDPASPTYQLTVNPHWTYAYDAAGNEVLQVSGDEQAAYQAWLGAGHTVASFIGGTAWAYDQNGDKVRQTLPDGELQTWAYDAHGDNTAHKVYSATDHTTALQTTLDTYDASAAHGGRLAEEDRYAADVTAGSPAAASPAERTTYAYDDAATLAPAERTDQGNVAEVDDYAVVNGTLAETDFTHYTYDPVTGSQATITTADGTIHYVYDEATGNLVETWTSAAADAAKSAAQNDVQYGYDAQGRLASVTQVVLNGSTPPAVSGGTRYDADGHAVATTGPTTVYTYDPAGNLLADAEPNGDTTAYVYNNVNQLTHETITNGAGHLLFGEHTDWYDNGQKQDVVDTRGDGVGNVTSQITYGWTYDNDDRLTSETLTIQSGSGSAVPAAYADAYTYDLDNNRVGKAVDGGAGEASGSTVAYTYDGDDQLRTETGTGAPAYQTSSTYDADGNLATQARTGTGAESDSYGYDLQDRMTSADVAGVATAYTYDADGVLTSEATAGQTPTYDLNDPNNLTGNSKAAQWSSTLGGVPTTSYVLGLGVEAQSDATNGTRYLLVDGHGSTCALANTSGAVVSGQTFDYDAFGTTLTNGDAAQTEWLFGGDGVYDHATGWTYQLARWRDASTFTQYDTYGGSSVDPIGLGKYVYADANPVSGSDPTGHYDGSQLTDDAFSEISGVVSEDIAGYDVVSSYAKGHLGQTTAYAEAGFALGDVIQNFVAPDQQAAFSLAGSVGGAASSLAGEFISEGISALISATRSGDAELAKLGEGVSEAASSVESSLESIACFVAGTDVLAGDRTSEVPIQNLKVGDRVATDDGVANSSDGNTADGDPTKTAVDPTTWREVTIDAGDWEVVTLEPLAWISSEHVTQGNSVDLNAVIDLQEMGIPVGVIGTVANVAACPTLQEGSGRLVLTTVTHLNSFLYSLNLNGADGSRDDLGVTGYHKIYTEDRGWVSAGELRVGEAVRTESGDATVASLVAQPGTYRVYNISVEEDHVYYVGNTHSLVHNVWCDGFHHIEPKYLGGDPYGAVVKLPGQLHQLAHRLIDERLEVAFGNAVAGYGRSTKLWSQYFARNAGAQNRALAIARNVVSDVLRYAHPLW